MVCHELVDYCEGVSVIVLVPFCWVVEVGLEEIEAFLFDDGGVVVVGGRGGGGGAYEYLIGG